MGPHEVTLTYEALIWGAGILTTGVTSWTLARAGIRRNKERIIEVDATAKVNFDTVNASAKRAHDRLDDVEREQIRQAARQEVKESELAKTLERIEEKQKEHGKKLDHLMTKGCAIGCKPSQGELK